MNAPTMPLATARLQFHKDFTLDDAGAVLDYYAALGISHIYASPLLTARAGSTHGYDVVDPTHINPELGGIEALRRFVARLRAAGMGLILDIVPNHMGVGAENPWWQHVLEWGRDSPFARWFDIDWDTADPALRGKLLAPFLGQPYGEALASGALRLELDRQSGRIVVGYFSQRFPVVPTCYADILQTGLPQQASADLHSLHAALAAFARIADGDTPQRRQEKADIAFGLLRDYASTQGGAEQIARTLRAFQPDSPADRTAILRLHELLEQQHYRLSWWRTAAEEINWRRFFEVSDLAGVRVEQDSVFDATHGLILQLYAEGLIDGLRIDHVDGLADPGAYCRKLRTRLQALEPQRAQALQTTAQDAGTAITTAHSLQPYIIVEKILTGGEQLRADWQVHGTTGYEFMDQVGALLHDPEGAEPLEALRAELGWRSVGFESEVLVARRHLLMENLAGEFDAAARSLHDIARADLGTRDFSLAAIRRVLLELLVAFPVYRTYAGDSGRDETDRQVFGQAQRAARCALRTADWGLLDQIGGWLGGVAPHSHANQQIRELCRRAITRFQQLTPPLTAKSVEDTAFYRYSRLLSRNEVGADPGQFSIAPADFHARCSARAQSFPYTLLATATHDHKRGEDVRARLAVLSELHQDWAERVRGWTRTNARYRVDIGGFDKSGELNEMNESTLAAEQCGGSVCAPNGDDELMLYQMLVGAWPAGLSYSDRAGVRAFAERIDQWQTKALREAKSASSWVDPNEAYEQGCRQFLYALLDPDLNHAFLRELADWVRHIAPIGAINSLAQTTLRLTTPGVPDLYQGTEWWDWSLVDPDNRRPVDYAARRRALVDMAGLPVAQLLEDWHRGHIKQALIQRLLRLRQQHPSLFDGAAYTPLALRGRWARHALAFVRCAASTGDSAAAPPPDMLLVVVPRLPARLCQSLAGQADGLVDGLADRPHVAANAWQDTCAHLPTDRHRRWVSVLDDSVLPAGMEQVPLAALLREWPVAILLGTPQIAAAVDG